MATKFRPQTKAQIAETTRKKFGELKYFAKYLPAIRRDIAKSLSIPGLEKEDIIYLALGILDHCHFRIGNDKYYNSTGLCTLLVKHISLHNDSINIIFHGKKQVINNCAVKNALIIKKIRALTRGKTKDAYIFQTIDGSRITAQDVNEYLKTKYHPLLTAKMFRTWHANMEFIKAVKNVVIEPTVSARKHQLTQIVKKTAAKLYHTPAICRRSYIHPALTRSFVEKGAMPVFDTPTKRTKKL